MKNPELPCPDVGFAQLVGQGRGRLIFEGEGTLINAHRVGIRLRTQLESRAQVPARQILLGPLDAQEQVGGHLDLRGDKVVHSLLGVERFCAGGQGGTDARTDVAVVEGR